jgi:formylglycine-generating enzyme required for sulfatase activity
VDEQIRALQEYVYDAYVEGGAAQPIDEEAACRVLDEYYARPDKAGDSDCFYPGILYFERGFEDEERKEEFFRRALFWLQRHRQITGEAWDAIDDRLLDIEDFFREAGVPATPLPPEGGAAGAVLEVAPALVEEIDDHGPMMLVPGGPFRFGAAESEMTLPAFYMDKFPVTNRQYEAFCRATGYRWPKYWTDERFNAPDAPVVGVSVADAQKYGRWVGKALPTEEQWEKATRGHDGREFPWGDDLPREGDACIGRDASTGGTCPVGAHPRTASPYGVADLVGNVWEWTATTVEDGETVHIIKGGCYNDPPDLCRAFMRLAAAPKDKHETIGFRCVKPV